MTCVYVCSFFWVRNEFSVILSLHSFYFVLVCLLLFYLDTCQSACIQNIPLLFSYGYSKTCTYETCVRYDIHVIVILIILYFIHGHIVMFIPMIILVNFIFIFYW